MEIITAHVIVCAPVHIAILTKTQASKCRHMQPAKAFHSHIASALPWQPGRAKIGVALGKAIVNTVIERAH